MKLSKLAVFMLVMAMVAILAGCSEKWVEIEPGLKYLDEVVGTGDEVQENSFVSMHYTGWLWVNGEKTTKFDSSLDGGVAFSTTLGQSRVFEGWDKGVPGMKVGGKRTLIIGYEMAFGAGGRPPKIPAKSDLYFEIEVTALPKVNVTVISEGTGPVVGVGDDIKVHYTGWVSENGAKGAEFDSSLNRGRPFPLKLGAGQVISGWEKGLEGLKTGTKATLIIPPVMGYGARGSGSVIPPNATLIFEVEILDESKADSSADKVEVQILSPGTGAVAQAGDDVQVHYTGWLWEAGVKGKKFDSSLDRGEPIQFTLGTGRVIKGWDQGLEGLKVGTKARLIIPSSLGYGPRGAGADIPPNANLCFDVELVGIKGK